jgi:hypothetical protein
LAFLSNSRDASPLLFGLRGPFSAIRFRYTALGAGFLHRNKLFMESRKKGSNKPVTLTKAFFCGINKKRILFFSSAGIDEISE